MFNSKKSRVILAIFTGLVILLVAWQISLFYQHRGLTRVNILVLPTDSKLMVDGQVKKPGTYYLTPGSHNLVASRQYFDNDVKDINTTNISPGDVIYMLPRVNSAEAKKWLLEHPEVQKQREAAGGAEAERTREILIKKYPVINKLPQENLHYKVDYSISADNKLEFTITLYAIINKPSQFEEYQKQLRDYKNEALKYLKDNGINTEGAKITFVPNV